MGVIPNEDYKAKDAASSSNVSELKTLFMTTVQKLSPYVCSPATLFPKDSFLGNYRSWLHGPLMWPKEVVLMLGTLGKKACNIVYTLHTKKLGDKPNYKNNIELKLLSEYNSYQTHETWFQKKCGFVTFSIQRYLLWLQFYYPAFRSKRPKTNFRWDKPLNHLHKPNIEAMDALYITGRMEY